MKTRNIRVLAAVVVLVSALASGGAEPQQPRPIETASGRFEGYHFLDADGRPLPFQSDEGVEAFLRNAAVISTSRIPVGVSEPRKLLLAEETLRAHAVFKDIDRRERKVRDKTAGKHAFHWIWRDWYGYDIAAYHVDRLLGLDRVPPVVQRRVKRREGSVQIWLEGVITEDERRERGLKPPDVARFNQQEQVLYLFDNLVANRDSNLGNSLIDRNWRLWFIDCSRCFGTSRELLYPRAITHCEKSLWQALRGLDPDQAHRRLSSYLTRAEIDALLARRDKLVAHIEALVAEWGEELILFEPRPPMETAPWANG